MGISTKNRRRLIVDNQPYLWWVATNDSYYLNPGDPVLTVATENRQFFVRYGLFQSDESRHLVVSTMVPGVVTASGNRFQCPAFGTTDSIRPTDVAALVRWCLRTDNPPVKVDFAGQPLLTGLAL